MKKMEMPFAAIGDMNLLGSNQKEGACKYKTCVGQME